MNMEKHTKIQRLLNEILLKVNQRIEVGMSEQDICEICKQELLLQGFTETWYYHVPALVYAGKRTTLSLSGRLYEPSKEATKLGDWVSIALSPVFEGCWGAMAQTFILTNNERDSCPEREAFIEFQQYLHREILSFSSGSTSFNEIYHFFNESIQNSGFINLDYNKSFGHSLENDLSKRSFIEKDNFVTLQEKRLIGFETHIGKAAFPFGSKLENVYLFDVNKLIKL